MVDATAPTVDVAKELPVALGRILVTSLLTAVFLRLANRISIRAVIPYKTAYLASLATNTITFFISLALGVVFASLAWKAEFAYLPALVAAIPLSASVYQRMIKNKEGVFIPFKAAVILSSTFFGVIVGLAFVLVGSLLAIGFLAK